MRKHVDLVPEWHAKAKCASTDDPTLYDAIVSPPLSVANNVDRAVALCSGCPTARECAREGLAWSHVQSVIRAGVPISDYKHEWIVAALEHVVETGDMSAIPSFVPPASKAARSHRMARERVR